MLAQVVQIELEADYLEREGLLDEAQADAVRDAKRALERQMVAMRKARKKDR